MELPLGFLLHHNILKRSKMAAKMAPSWILLKIQICRENAKIANIFPTVVECDRIEHFDAFGSILYVFFIEKWCKTRIFIQKWLDLMLLMTAYIITTATDSRQTYEKCVSMMNEQLLKTAYANNECC